MADSKQKDESYPCSLPCSVIRAKAHMDAAVTHEKLVTTEFTAQEAVVEEAHRPIVNTDDYSHEFATIKKFLERPYEITSGSWADTAGVNTTLYSTSVSQALLANSTWMNKISGYGLVRGTAVIRVQINANPFQQGRLLLHFVPGYQHLATVTTNTLLLQKTQHPGVELDCRQSEVILKIPYVAPSLYFDINLELYDWGTFFLDVLSPLQIDPTSASASVQYSVWLNFEDFEVAAPIPAVPFMESEVKAVSDRPVSTALKSAGKVFRSVRGIPVISDYARPLEWASDVGAKLAYTLGYAKPQLEDSETLVVSQYNRYSATAEGPDVSYPLSLSSSNMVKHDSDFSLRSEDEMSFEFLKRIDCLYKSYSWTEATTGNLAEVPVSPLGFFASTTFSQGAHNMTVQAYIPSSHIARLFSMWRGSYDVTLKFVKTQFHSGRLQVMWLPGSSAAIGTSDMQVAAARSIIDLRYTDEVTFNLPWLMVNNYASVNDISGRLRIDVLNPLKAPSNVSTSVNILMYVKAGKDFELAAPFSPTVVNAIAGTPHVEILTVETLGSQNNPPLITDFAEASAGEVFRSVKQLLLRYSYMAPASTGVLGAGGYAINPFYFEGVTMGLATGNIRYPNWGGSILSQIAAMYYSFRGGMRVAQDMPNPTMVSAGQPADWQLFLINQSNLPNNDFVQLAPNPSAPAVWALPASSTSLATSGIVRHSGNTVYYRVPYFNDCRFTIVRLDDFAAPAPAVDRPFVAGCAFIMNGAGSVITAWQRAVADDFSLGYFVATPLVITAYS